MTTAIIISVLIFALIVGGMMTLLKNKDFKIPDDYDPEKSGYEYDEDDDQSSGF
ncbi:MAG: DUF2897 family protein [Kangiellaceae bacterium]|nr:DUF2897 family protein [Kangiellaceae bacterium]